MMDVTVAAGYRRYGFCNLLPVLISILFPVCKEMTKLTTGCDF